MMATEFTPVASLLGGLLIGLAAVVLMIGNGRIAGVSGILASALAARPDGNVAWRWAFIVGIFAGAALAATAGVYDPDSVRFPATGFLAAAAGLLVGIGTSVGGGCTSGHGVCGMARLSRRSLAATGVFMLVAFAVVFITRHIV
jgi:uncharacterized membrane protein YedE/YeeE